MTFHSVAGRLARMCAVTAALPIFLSGCHGGNSAERMTSYSQSATASATPQLFTIPEDQMQHVQVVTVEPSTMTNTLRLTGTVAYNAFNTTPVITQVGGPVSKILVVPGQSVKAGQPMLEVSSPDYAQTLDAYLKALDSYHLEQKYYARAQQLYQNHAIAERDLEQAESDLNQSKADFAAAEEAMRILGIKNPGDLEKSPTSAEIPVLAPIGGEVVERLVSPGQVVQAGQTQAFTISDLRTVWVLANVYQADLQYIRDGDNVVVQTDAYPTTFHGRISYISPALDPNTRTLQARIEVENPGEKLKRDMYCNVLVTAGVLSNVLAVPNAAILRDDNNEPFVYLLTGSHQFRRSGVELGEAQDGKTQIRRGISAGDKVVGNGSLFLQFANSLQH